MQKTKTYYSYDIDRFYIGTGEAQISPKHEEIGQEWYMLPANATFIAVPNFNAELEIPRFDLDTQAWSVVDVEIEETLYLKADGSKHEKVLLKNYDLYTPLKPLEFLKPETTQSFNDVAEKWEYTGVELQRQILLSQLEADFNASKKITIQNGKTIYIAYDTPERKYFLELIENPNKPKDIDNLVFEYQQKTDEGGLGFRILPEIASYIFKNLFVVDLADGTTINSRRRNKAFIYNHALEQINNATTQTELDSISWKFLNPQGIVIDVNDKATQMLKDATVSEFAKAAINAAKDPITGEIHLVRTVAAITADS